MARKTRAQKDRHAARLLRAARDPQCCAPCSSGKPSACAPPATRRTRTRTLADGTELAEEYVYFVERTEVRMGLVHPLRALRFASFGRTVVKRDGPYDTYREAREEARDEQHASVVGEWQKARVRGSMKRAASGMIELVAEGGGEVE